MQQPISPKNNLIRGAIWTLGTRWLVKSIGFINTIIMARLLLPEDYGLVAMAMLTANLVETFLDFSATVALLRKDELNREEINSAWTLRLIQGGIAGVLIAIISPLAVSFFKETRLLEILWAISGCVILAGFNNVGQTLALKKFNYTLDFKISIITKLSSVIIAITAGLILHDYRALILGIMAGYITPLILSYCLHPYRPKWETTKIPEIWSVTKWLMLANIAGFLMRKSDELVAGRIGTTREFGMYSVGADLGQLPVSEVGPAMQRAILPALVSIKNDVERTRLAILKTLSAVFTVIWPIGMGFAALSHEATHIILGANWHSSSSYVAIFAITATLQSSGGPFKSFLTLLGHTRIQNTVTWIEFLGFIISALILTPYFHLLGLAYARLISTLLSMLFLTFVTERYCKIRIGDAMKSTYRPIFISLIMYLLVSNSIDNFDTDITKLVVGIAVGAFFYIPTIFLLWHLSGRPEGLESTLFDKITQNRS